MQIGFRNAVNGDVSIPSIKSSLNPSGKIMGCGFIFVYLQP